MYKLTGKELVAQTIEKVPCGHSVTTQYYIGEKLVRQDVEIQVDEKTFGLLRGAAGDTK